MSYVVPQALVFQDFQQVASAIVAPLRAHISGGHAYLLRYAEPVEKPQGSLGAYNTDADVAYSWPQLPVGGIVDPGYTKLYIDNALMPYYTDLIGVGSAVAPIGVTAANRIQAADSSGGFKANGSSHSRYAALYDRDVQPGDAVHVRGVVSSTPYLLDTYVQAILSTGSDRVAATAATPAAGVTNPDTQVASTTVTVGTGNTNTSTLTSSASLYKPYAVGVVNDTYTITDTGSEVGSDPTTATLRITSASGRDDQLLVNPAADTVAFAIGALGLTVTITKDSGTPQPLVAGQVWTVGAHAAHVEPTPATGGVYVGTSASTYIVTVTRGGYFAGSGIGLPTITVSTTTGIDVSGPTVVTSDSAAYPLGTKGLTFTVGSTGTPLGLRKGDVWYVAVTPNADGDFRTLVLGHNLPTELLDATDLDLTLAINRSLQIPHNRVGFEPVTNWEQSGTELTVHSGIIAYDPTYTNLGAPVPLTVESGHLYVEYRAWRQELTGDVNAVSDVGNLDAAIRGPLTPDNPLKWGVYKALANSNGTDVKFTAVGNPDDIDSWEHVIELLVGRTDLYNLVPLTLNTSILELFVAHINDQSSPKAGRWRAMFLTVPLVTTKARVTAVTSSNGDPVLALVADDPNTSGTQYTYLTVPLGNSDFTINGVQPGDIVRAEYSTDWGVTTYNEYPIAEVINENSLLLATGPATAIVVPSKIEVWHNLSKTEQATSVGQSCGVYANARVVAVWPDLVGDGGISFSGYHLCAALAGLVSGVAPHQGLTNIAIAGFDDVSRASVYFNTDQLNIIAGDGGWIVTQSSTGAIYTRHALASATVDINHSEEMVRRNVDAMSYVFLNRLAPFIGVTNVTPTALARLHVELVSAIEYLKSNGYTDLLGSQLIDGVVTSLRPSLLLKDRVVASITLTIPYPLNEFELHLVI